MGEVEVDVKLVPSSLRGLAVLRCVLDPRRLVTSPEPVNSVGKISVFASTSATHLNIRISTEGACQAAFLKPDRVEEVEDAVALLAGGELMQFPKVAGEAQAGVTVPWEGWVKYFFVFVFYLVGNQLADGLFDSPTDVKVVCSDDAVLYGHSHLLIRASSYWQAMLDGNWAEGQPVPTDADPNGRSEAYKVVHIQARRAVVALYLERTISDEVNFAPDVSVEDRVRLLKELYELADMFDDTKLLSTCQSQLLAPWTPEHLALEAFGDFARRHAAIAAALVDKMVTHAAAVKATSEWQERLKDFVDARDEEIPLDPDEADRARWPGVMLGKLCQAGF